MWKGWKHFRKKRKRRQEVRETSSNIVSNTVEFSFFSLPPTQPALQLFPCQVHEIRTKSLGGMQRLGRDEW